MPTPGLVRVKTKPGTVTVNMFYSHNPYKHKRNKKMNLIIEYGCAGIKEQD